MHPLPIPERFYRDLPDLLRELNMQEEESESIEPYMPSHVVKQIALSAADFAAGLAAAFEGDDTLLLVVQLTNGFTQTLLQREWLIEANNDDAD